MQLGYMKGIGYYVDNLLNSLNGIKGEHYSAAVRSSSQGAVYKTICISQYTFKDCNPLTLS